MARYIDADKAIREWCGRNCGCEPEECGHTLEEDGTEACVYVDFLNEQPTADVVERKTGKWIKRKGRCCWYCSYCNTDDYYAYSWNCETGEYELQDHYCPNCGARLEGFDNGKVH